MSCNNKTILVTGGAGYIGSHICIDLLDNGYTVAVLDNLSSGYLELLPDGVSFYQGDIRDFDQVNAIFDQAKPDAVIHMAAFADVEESMSKPLAYYENNTHGTACVLKACETHGVQHFVFSSTCAVYGTPEKTIVVEGHPLNACSPYGESKKMAEKIIQDTCELGDMTAVILRYFNVAGSDPRGRTGLCNPKVGRLDIRAAQAVLGELPQLTVFGTDYDTPDGSCVRDYIHVSDLATAHVKALEYLFNGGKTDIFNAGYGAGYSVKEFIAAMKRVSGVDFPVTEGGRRAGDAAKITGQVNKIKTTLNWKPRYDDLDVILQSTLDWRKGLDAFFSDKKKAAG